ncbi:MAG: DUF4260 domain-containing protein [Deinococcota bacterium]
MNVLLKLEEAAELGLSLWLFFTLGIAWWLYLLFLLAPDIGMLGYLVSPRTGSLLYNLFHHKGIAIILLIVGLASGLNWLAFIGTLLLGHAALDRVLGYGLKYSDAFGHTHLGWVGQAAKSKPS